MIADAQVQQLVHDHVTLEGRRPRKQRAREGDAACLRARSPLPCHALHADPRRRYAQYFRPMPYLLPELLRLPRTLATCPGHWDGSARISSARSTMRCRSRRGAAPRRYPPSSAGIHPRCGRRPGIARVRSDLPRESDGLFGELAMKHPVCGEGARVQPALAPRALGFRLLSDESFDFRQRLLGGELPLRVPPNGRRSWLSAGPRQRRRGAALRRPASGATARRREGGRQRG